MLPMPDMPLAYFRFRAFSRGCPPRLQAAARFRLRRGYY